MTDISQFCLQKLNTGFACPVSNTEYILAHSLIFAADLTIEYYKYIFIVKLNRESSPSAY